MNVNSEEFINFVNEFAECAFGDYFLSRVCDATIVKMVWQNVDQNVD